LKNYDVIIIGAGSAGLGNAGVANTIGLKTLLIEKDANHFGGDCTNFGCVPSKALIHIANHFHSAQQATRFGLKSSGKANMQEVLKYIHEKQEVIRGDEDAEALRKKGIEVLIGVAQFEDKQTVRVGEALYRAKLMLLCTGSSPRKLEIEGMDTVAVYTNETIFFDCKVLPENLVVIGGGPIGCELGQAFSRLGSKVTIVNRGSRLLSKEPERVSGILEEQFNKEGITILNNATVQKIEDKKAKIEIEGEDNKDIECDTILLAVGRVVKSKGLSLDKAGVELTDEGKIKTNRYLQTTNPKVYAIGDAAGSYMFSHGAEKMVRMLWRNLLIPIFKKENTLKDLSWVTFTDPQVAHFGLSEVQLEDQGINFYRQDQSLEEDDRAIIQEYTFGHQSLWMETASVFSSRKLLSGSLIAPNAGEMMQELELARHAGISINDISSRVYPYPVQSRINQKTIRGVIMKSYTAWKKKLARFAFRFFH
jgi:pyruvate/2-oxoglutarate dehydrogenase complex dihydrolipoamide dehydrogenase (E3) component